MSAHAEPTYALALLEAGSEGRAYLLKDRLHSRAQLLATIEAVARGGSVIDPKVVEALVHGRPRQARLAARRSHAARAGDPRGDGSWSEQRGDREALGLTKRAVEKHINAVFAKLDLPLSEDVSRRVRAVLLYLAGTDRVVPTLDTASRRQVG